MAQNKYGGEKTVIAYVHLKQSAQEMLLRAENEEDGSYYTSMMALVASAFMLEAFLNHIGAELFKSWDALEGLGPRNKLDVVAEKLKLNIAPEKAPWQSVRVLIGFRNKLAHAKTETISGTWFGDPGGTSSLTGLETKWEKLCRPEIAREHYDGALAVIEAIWEKAGKKPGLAFFVASTGRGGQL